MTPTFIRQYKLTVGKDIIPAVLSSLANEPPYSNSKSVIACSQTVNLVPGQYPEEFIMRFVVDNDPLIATTANTVSAITRTTHAFGLSYESSEVIAAQSTALEAYQIIRCLEPNCTLRSVYHDDAGRTVYETNNSHICNAVILNYQTLIRGTNIAGLIAPPPS